MLNTKVTLTLESNLLRDYLGYLFEKSSRDEYIVTARNDFGKLLIAHLKAADREPTTKSSCRTVTLQLPSNGATLNFNNKYVYYSSQSISQLNNALTAIFNMDFWRYSLQGKSMKLRKEEMIEAFICSRKLLSDEFFESLHKRAYRKDIERLKLLTKKLKRRYYYIDSLYCK